MNKNLRKVVSEELVRRGYRRFDRMHLLPVYEEWYFWVDTGPLGKRAEISPYVGIRYGALERLLSELLSLPEDKTVGSVGANIGYILDGKYQEWGAGEDKNVVLSAIEAAFSRLRPLMVPDKLAELWKMTAAQDPLWRYREIALLVLQHDREKAQDQLLAASREFCRYDDAIATDFRKFESRVLMRLNSL